MGGDISECKSWGRIALSRTEINMRAAGGDLLSRLDLTTKTRAVVDASVLNGNTRCDNPQTPENAMNDPNGDAIQYCLDDDGHRVVYDYDAPGVNVDHDPQPAFMMV